MYTEVYHISQVSFLLGLFFLVLVSSNNFVSCYFICFASFLLGLLDLDIGCPLRLWQWRYWSCYCAFPIRRRRKKG